FDRDYTITVSAYINGDDEVVGLFVTAVAAPAPAHVHGSFTLDDSVTETNSTCTTKGQKPVYKCGVAGCNEADKRWLDSAGTTVVANGNDKKDLAAHQYAAGTDESGSGGTDNTGKCVCSVCGDSHETYNSGNSKPGQAGCSICTAAGMPST
ncbi:hypothetical protein AALA54_17730, partial [Oscillospiraceae bacterium 44-34]